MIQLKHLKLRRGLKLSILTLIVSILQIQSLQSQVLESNNCFTDEQTDFFIEESFIIADQAETIKNRDSVIYIQKDIIQTTKRAYIEKDQELAYKSLAFDNCAAERVTVYNQLNHANAVIKRKNITLKISVGISIGALTYIAIKR